MIVTVFLAVFIGAYGAGAGNPLLPGIKGDDDRAIVESTVYPWSAIGRLNKSIGGFCTGTLVGERLVLTAAHCLWNKRTRRFLSPGSLHFIAGYNRGDYLKHSKAVGITIGEGYRPEAPANAATAANDWALVTLAEGIGKDVGILPVAGLGKSESNGDRIAQAGYSQDKAHVLTINRACRLLGYTKGKKLLAHDCDAVPGDSGSPIFIADGDTFSIAAIHVATSKGAGETLGLAVPASAFKEAVERLTSQAIKVAR